MPDASGWDCLEIPWNRKIVAANLWEDPKTIINAIGSLFDLFTPRATNYKHTDVMVCDESDFTSKALALGPAEDPWDTFVDLVRAKAILGDKVGRYCAWNTLEFRSDLASFLSS